MVASVHRGRFARHFTTVPICSLLQVPYRTDIRNNTDARSLVTDHELEVRLNHSSRGGPSATRERGAQLPLSSIKIDAANDACLVS
jgi:hypothetical protein